MLKSLRRLSWGVADQGLSSITNFAIGILAARSLGARQFGAFSAAFAAYLIAVGASRAIASTPMLIRHASDTEPEWREASTHSTGTALATGLSLGIISILVSLVLPSDLQSAFLAMGMSLPGLLLQDSWRYAFFAHGRGRSSFVNDLVWALLIVPGAAWALKSHSASPGLFLILWGSAGTIAGLAGIVQSKSVPNPRAGGTWLRRNRDLAPAFLGDYMATVGSWQIALYAIGFVSGLESVGALRGGQLLLGPITVVYMGVGLVLVPEGVKLKDDLRQLHRSTVLVSTILTLIGLIWASALLAVPDAVGTTLLGESWMAARRVAFPLGLMLAAQGASTGPVVALRSLAAGRRCFRARLVVAPLVPLAGIVGALVSGPELAAYGIALATFAGAVVWWLQFRAEVRSIGPKQATQLRDQAVLRLPVDGSRPRGK